VRALALLYLFPVLPAAAAVVTLFGCGRAPAQVRQPPPPPKPAVSHEIAGTTVRFADPKGRWTFEVRADRVEAETVHGPYEMRPARARYDELGKPPVTMSAQRAHVDEQARRVTFEGEVLIASPAWRLHADRVDYDLKTGKVVASGQTKWVSTEGATPTAQPPSSRKEDRP
jgi:hypothetical protein